MFLCRLLVSFLQGRFLLVFAGFCFCRQVLQAFAGVCSFAAFSFQFSVFSFSVGHGSGAPAQTHGVSFSFVEFHGNRPSGDCRSGWRARTSSWTSTCARRFFRTALGTAVRRHCEPEDRGAHGLSGEGSRRCVLMNSRENEESRGRDQQGPRRAESVVPKIRQRR